MPEQLGRRALPITNQPSLEPFETPVVSLGTKGLNLTDAADTLQPGEFRVLTNLEHQQDGQLTVRPGTTTLTATHGTLHHSVRRLNDPDDGSFTRVYGVDDTVAIGTTSLSSVDSGYSGDPLTFCPYRPPLSGETWMFLADRDRMRKIRSDGTDLPIGVRPPTTALNVSANAALQTSICEFDATDASAAVNWTGVAGYDYSEPPVATETPVAGDGGGVNGDTVELLTVPAAVMNTTGTGYYSFWTIPRTIDLTKFGAVDATDDDLLHTWVKFSHPDLTTEFRVYFVCSATFDGATLPGTSPTGANGDFYYKAWRTHDFSQALQANAAVVDSAETARVHTIRDDDLLRRKIVDGRPDWREQQAERDPARAVTLQTGAGREQWVEYGRLGVPVRRGDFQRVGSTAGRDWATITGMVIYIQTAEGVGGAVAVSLDDMYLTGGSNPDSCEPGAQPYDYRYTHYDPRTGAEGNPSPEQDDGDAIDLLRQSATLDPAAFGTAAMRQRFYRRGGSTIADWYFLGENTSDGGQFTDNYTDAEALAAGTVELDNDQAVSSVDSSGVTIQAQEAAVIFGPVEDLLFILGDPHRPGDVYYCKPGRPDSWPASNRTEVCSPSEELMNGGVHAGQAFCLSRERLYLLYPSLSTAATTVTSVPGACTKGLAARWALAVGRGGIYFLAEDGIYRTTGGPEELLSRDVSPLFAGLAVGDYEAVDYTVPTALRLTLHDWDLYFHYQDTAGARQCLVYSVLYQYWRAVTWPVDGLSILHGYSDEGASSDQLLLGGDSGVTYTRSGLTDGGAAIVYAAVTGDYAFGRPREDKLFGDLILDVNSQDQDTNLITRLNHGAVVNATQVVNGGDSRARIILDSFGVLPQKARTLSVELSGASSTTPPIFYQLGAALIPQPDVTVTRVTQWDDLGHPSEVYLTGLILDVDTADGAKEFLVEYDLEGVWATIGPFNVQADNRHKFFFSWPAVKANLVRVRPIGDCTPWMLYRADWIFDPEPPRIAGWDINWENSWDQYVTGLDLECDTFGLAKTVELWIDQVNVQTYTVTALGRRVVHLTVQPPVRGHILRAVATDANPGLLYTHRWHRDAEPSEQTNWNQNYTIAGTLGDKWLKAVLFECDTFGEDKTVTLEIDGTVVETLTVNTSGRSVVQFSFAQHLGRVFRILPTDANPSRLYSHQLVFDQEPFKLARWETQEITHGIPGWQVPYEAHITLKSAVDVTLTVSSYRQDGSVTTKEYLIPKTGTAKIKRYVPFQQSKGVLFKYLLTASQAFWLYREETEVLVAPWGSNSTHLAHVFGNDDIDQTRGMINAALASARPGGGL